MKTVKSWVIGPLFALALGSAACSTPSSPTPQPPPPPTAGPPLLSCGEGVSRATVDATGVAVSFDLPPVTAGEGTVTVTCTDNETGKTIYYRYPMAIRKKELDPETRRLIEDAKRK